MHERAGGCHLHLWHLIVSHGPDQLLDLLSGVPDAGLVGLDLAGEIQYAALDGPSAHFAHLFRISVVAAGSRRGCGFGFRFAGNVPW
jgi:hypothetical protein